MLLRFLLFSRYHPCNNNENSLSYLILLLLFSREHRGRVIYDKEEEEKKILAIPRIFFLSLWLAGPFKTNGHNNKKIYIYWEMRNIYKKGTFLAEVTRREVHIKERERDTNVKRRIVFFSSCSDHIRCCAYRSRPIT